MGNAGIGKDRTQIASSLNLQKWELATCLGHLG